MTAQLAVAGLIGVAIWSLIAVNVVPVGPSSAYFTAKNGAQPVALIIRCDDPKKPSCRVREQMNKIKRASQ